MLTLGLLVIHITGGVLALLTGAVAIGVQALHGPHRVHVIAGRCFVLGMIMVVVAALPLSVIFDSALLFLIGIFSGYLMLVGWRLATNRKGEPTPIDWALDGLMLSGSVTMIVVGIVSWADRGVVLLVFGIIGIALSGAQLILRRKGPVRGRFRIGSHLQFMIAGYIAALTAFLVVNNVAGIFAWFLPTLLLTPVLIVWKRRVEAGGRTTLDRQPAPRRRAPVG